jgi:hypothetical protein
MMLSYSGTGHVGTGSITGSRTGDAGLLLSDRSIAGSSRTEPTTMPTKSIDATHTAAVSRTTEPLESCGEFMTETLSGAHPTSLSWEMRGADFSVDLSVIALR